MNRDDLPAEVAALVAEARNKALDEAAKVALDLWALNPATNGYAIAASIRALKEAT